MKKLIISIIFLISVFACDVETTEQTPSAKELLTQSWQLISLSTDGGSQPVFGQSVLFKDDGTFSISLANLPNTGTWQLANGDTQLSLNNGIALLRIISINSEQLILEFTTTNYKNGNVLYRAEFTKA